MPKARGYRGYVAARPVRGNRVPQHVQNLVIRDFAHRHALAYKLSGTEYAMPGCYMMLEEILDELPQLEGIIVYTLFMLPRQTNRRLGVYRRVIEAGKTLHGAVEGLSIANWDDAGRVEDIWRVQLALDHISARG